MTDDLLEELQPPIPPGFVPVNWYQGFGRLIGPLYEKITPDGKFSRAFLVAEHHTNGMKNCHGGMLMAFADMAFGHAISLGTHRFWVTVRLVTDFISSAQVGDWVEGNGEIVGSDGDLHTVRGKVWSGDRLIMTGTGIFKSLGERPMKAHWVSGTTAG